MAKHIPMSGSIKWMNGYLIKCIGVHGCSRSGAGTLFVKPGRRVVDSCAIPAEIMDGVRPLGDFYLNVLTKENDIDWIFLSSAGTFDEKDERTGEFRLGKDDLIIDPKTN